MTVATLRSQTANRQNGIAGWHSMRKAELIDALSRLSRKRASVGQNGVSSKRRPSEKQAQPPNPRIRRKIDQLHRKLATIKSLASNESKTGCSSSKTREDRLVVMVRDPYWLHAFWELSEPSIERAKAAMGTRWHGAQPTLRLFQTEEAGASSYAKDITIHGGVNNWYVDVQNPPCDFKMEIGYLADFIVWREAILSKRPQQAPATRSTTTGRTLPSRPIVSTP